MSVAYKEGLKTLLSDRNPNLKVTTEALDRLSVLLNGLNKMLVSECIANYQAAKERVTNKKNDQRMSHMHAENAVKKIFKFSIKSCAMVEGRKLVLMFENELLHYDESELLKVAKSPVNQVFERAVVKLFNSINDTNKLNTKANYYVSNLLIRLVKELGETSIASSKIDRILTLEHVIHAMRKSSTLIMFTRAHAHAMEYIDLFTKGVLSFPQSITQRSRLQEHMDPNLVRQSQVHMTAAMWQMRQHQLFVPGIEKMKADSENDTGDPELQNDAVIKVDNILTELLLQIATASVRRTIAQENKNLNPIQIKAAVCELFPNDLSKRSISQAEKVMVFYNNGVFAFRPKRSVQPRRRSFEIIEEPSKKRRRTPDEDIENAKKPRKATALDFRTALRKLFHEMYCGSLSKNASEIINSWLLDLFKQLAEDGIRSANTRGSLQAMAIEECVESIFEGQLLNHALSEGKNAIFGQSNPAIEITHRIGNSHEVFQNSQSTGAVLNGNPFSNQEFSEEEQEQRYIPPWTEFVIPTTVNQTVAKAKPSRFHMNAEVLLPSFTDNVPLMQNISLQSLSSSEPKAFASGQDADNKRKGASEDENQEAKSTTGANSSSVTSSSDSTANATTADSATNLSTGIVNAETQETIVPVPTMNEQMNLSPVTNNSPTQDGNEITPVADRQEENLSSVFQNLYTQDGTVVTPALQEEMEYSTPVTRHSAELDPAAHASIPIEEKVNSSAFTQISSELNPTSNALDAQENATTNLSMMGYSNNKSQSPSALPPEERNNSTDAGAKCESLSNGSLESSLIPPFSCPSRSPYVSYELDSQIAPVTEVEETNSSLIIQNSLAQDNSVDIQTPEEETFSTPVTQHSAKQETVAPLSVSQEETTNSAASTQICPGLHLASNSQDLPNEIVTNNNPILNDDQNPNLSSSTIQLGGRYKASDSASLSNEVSESLILPFSAPSKSPYLQYEMSSQNSRDAGEEPRHSSPLTRNSLAQDNSEFIQALAGETKFPFTSSEEIDNAVSQEETLDSSTFTQNSSELDTDSNIQSTQEELTTNRPSILKGVNSENQSSNILPLEQKYKATNADARCGSLADETPDNSSILMRSSPSRSPYVQYELNSELEDVENDGERDITLTITLADLTQQLSDNQQSSEEEHVQPKNS